MAWISDPLITEEKFDSAYSGDFEMCRELVIL